jgi:hypothetical protein
MAQTPALTCCAALCRCMQEFLLFFSKVSRTISNKEFDEMITEMQG